MNYKTVSLQGYDTFVELCFKLSWLISCPRARRFYRDLAVALLVMVYLVGWGVKRTLVLLAGDDVTRNTSQMASNFILYVKGFFRVILEGIQVEVEMCLKTPAVPHVGTNWRPGGPSAVGLEGSNDTTTTSHPVPLEVDTRQRKTQASEASEYVGTTPTLRELKQIARERGLKGYSRLSKAQLLDRLQVV